MANNEIIVAPSNDATTVGTTDDYTRADVDSNIPDTTTAVSNTTNDKHMDREDSIYSGVSYASKLSFTSRIYNLIIEDAAKNFHPVYFVSIMGTGISSSILFNFPFEAHWLKICSYIMFAITCLFFIGTTTLFILSCMYFPGRFREYHVDTSKAVFMGCYSMGYITIVNFIEILADGNHVIFVWVLWWLAVFSAMFTAFIIVFFAFMSKLNKVDTAAKLNATLLLPIVAITVVSSSGHQLELKLPTLNQTVVTMVVSFMLWCLSISLAFVIITLYFGRLIVHKIPPTHLVFSSFLPVGFLGQSSYSILLFGINLNTLIPEDQPWGKILVCICGFISLFLLSFGYFMTFVAIMSIFSKIKPFAKTPNPQHTNKYGLLKLHKGFWAMTFPLGTMSLSNNELGKGVVGNYPLLTFKVMGAVFGAACVLVTISCTIGVVVTLVKKFRSLFAKRSISIV
ncbi:Sulfite efflux pump SSU1 [Spathaspora sp. JA1]|nr:Sulfite efflux pump SSU1 [Spathaspora sp. JA1]